MADERLQKILARAGISSRRAAEDLIEQGRVMVNGTKATLGMSADASRDDIRLDGERIKMPQSFDYFLLNKPKGVISDEDVAQEHQNARDLIPVEGHLYPVGRLDLNSEGLMLFTNDGALAHKLTHPRYDHPKTYHVVVEGNPSEEALDQWRHGIMLEGKRTRPAEVKKVQKSRTGTVLEVTMREGRKRQIRKVAARLGCPVISLIRTSLGPLTLGDLPTGAWRRLTPQEVEALLSIREQAEPRRMPRPAPRPSNAVGRPAGRRPMPKGAGSSRTTRSNESTNRRSRTEPSGDTSHSDRPVRRGWADDERRGVARSEARPTSDSRGGSKPPRSGQRPDRRGRPTSDTRSEGDNRNRSPRPQQDSDRQDRPARPTRSRPSSTPRTGESRGGKPQSGPNRGSSAQRPSRGGKPAPNRSGGKPGQSRRTNKPNQSK